MAGILHQAKMYMYTLLGAGVIGVGLSLWANLNKTIILPAFPDSLDALSVVSVGCLLLYEVVRQSKTRFSS